MKNRDGVEIVPGQQWRDLDKRQPNRVRTVLRLDEINGRVLLGIGLPPGTNAKFTSWVSAKRMHRHATGWELVSSADSASGGEG